MALSFNPALPLMPDPPVTCFWEWITWKDYKVKKIAIWRVFVPKKSHFFLTHRAPIHPMHTRRAHAHPADGPVHVLRFFRRDLRGKGEVSAAARRRRVPPLDVAESHRRRWISRSRRGWRGGPGAVAGEQGKAAAAPHADHLLAAERKQGGGRLEARPLP
jgi:hypothetical protein